MVLSSPPGLDFSGLLLTLLELGLVIVIVSHPYLYIDMGRTLLICYYMLMILFLPFHLRFCYSKLLPFYIRSFL